jgi:hypothetical protein
VVVLKPQCNITKVQGYREVDVPAFAADIKGLCGGDAELTKIFVGKPKALCNMTGIISKGLHD